ncbi:MAG: hypothetical protein QNK29_14435 [Desulfobacterales bacterium]|nr:hypothetical protein [Desulfobacterales bacterium]
MNPALILFGIRSIIRLGKIAKDASEQYVRDSEALFPNIRTPHFDRKNFVTGFFGTADYKHYVDAPNAPYKECWGTYGVIDDLNAVDILFAAAVKIKTEEGVDLNQWLSDSQTIAGATLIQQWDPRKDPLSPFARIILAAGDIALEYVAANPGIIGVNGNGEKLIGAYAQNLSDLLPNDGQFGEKEKFAERLLGVFLRAGLDTICHHPEWVVSEEHLKNLIESSVKSVVKALPEDITEQLNYREVAEALMGSAASAAMQVLAEHPVEFMGSAFSAETAIGTLTKALLEQATETGLKKQLTKEGLLTLYRTALGVAARQPQLFLTKSGDPEEELAKAILSNFAAVLIDTPPPFNGDIGVKLAAAALDAVGTNTHRFAEKDQPWHETAAEMVTILTQTLKPAFETNQDIRTVFSKDQLIELGRILLDHVASTPEMIIEHNDALRQLTTAVAQTMAQDKNLLLNGDDWLEIVKIAAQESASNPGRLFQLDPGNPNQSLAIKVIATLFKSAEDIIHQETLKGKSVLFGQTLRQAIIIVIQATAGNPEAANANLHKIALLSHKLNELVAQNSGRFGNKEWLYLFRNLLSGVLDGKEVGELTVEKIETLLLGRTS